MHRAPRRSSAASAVALPAPLSPLRIHQLLDAHGDRSWHAGHRGDLLDARVPDAVDAPEVAEQRPPPRGSQPTDDVEPRAQRLATAAGAVSGDGEAVRLVTHPLHQEEGRAVGGEEHRVGSAGEEELLVALGEAGDGDVAEPHLHQHRVGGAELALAAVDEDEVGKHAEALVRGVRPPAGPPRALGRGGVGDREPLRLPRRLGHPAAAVAPGRVVDGDVLGATGASGVAADPPAQGLLHRGEVVGALDRLDPEVAVVVGTRPAVLEHHHRAHRVGAHGVADVVALDAPWQVGEVEPGLQVGEEPPGALGVEVGLDPLLAERRLRGPRGLVDKLAGGAPLGDAHLDGTTALLAEELLEHGVAGRALRDHQGAREARRVAVVQAEEALERVGGAEPGDALDGVVLHHRHLALAHREDGHHPTVAFEGDPDHVAVVAGAAHHPLALADAVDGTEPVAGARRRLVVEPLRRLAHLRLQLGGEHLGVTLHEELHLVEQPGVAVGVDVPGAGAAAALDVVVEADAAATEHLVAAGAEGEDGAQRLHRRPQRLGAGVGAEVARSVAGHPPGVVGTGEHRRPPHRLGAAARGPRPLPRRPGGQGVGSAGSGDLQVEVVLVILEANVEARAVALDELVLEEQGLALAAAEDHREVEDPLHQLAGAQRVGLDPAEVGAEPVAQARRLAHIDDPRLEVAHQVDPGTVRRLLQPLAEQLGVVEQPGGTRRGGGHGSTVLCRGLSRRRLPAPPGTGPRRAPGPPAAAPSPACSPARRRRRRRGSCG